MLGQSGKAAIHISAHGVSLDLNGYSFQAAVGATKGIIVGSEGGPVMIRNGLLRFWPQQSIQFTQASDFTIQDGAIVTGGGGGIDALGRGTIERVTAKGAMGRGIYLKPTDNWWCATAAWRASHRAAAAHAPVFPRRAAACAPAPCAP